MMHTPAMIMKLSGRTEPLEPLTHAGQFHDPKFLTTVDGIEERISALVGRGQWSPSKEARDARGLLIAIGARQVFNVANGEGQFVTRQQVEDLLFDAGCPFPDDNAALGALLQDQVVGKTRDGGVGVLAPPADPAADPWPGWDGPVPAKIGGPAHMPVAWQREQMQMIYAAVLAEGLPEGLRLPADQDRHFRRARRRGRVALCGWVWASLLNQAIPLDRHPVSAKTAMRRLADLDEAGQLVKVKRARTAFDPGRWAFRTQAAEFSYPAPGVRGVGQKIRRMIRAKLPTGNDDGFTPVPPAWRLQEARWRFRDDERWQARWGH